MKNSNHHTKIGHASVADFIMRHEILSYLALCEMVMSSLPTRKPIARLTISM
jgi:hypothetical protein